MAVTELTQEGARHCLAALREKAPDLYLATLLLPSELRGPVAVLRAFHAEIAGLALTSPEPLAGEIRLQWWREVVEGERSGEAQGDPLAASLRAVIETHDLPPKALDDKLSAHIFDFYRDPMPNRATLEGYFGETRSALFRLEALIAGGEQNRELADACGHGGVAFGIAWMLQNMALQRALGQIYVPVEMLEAQGLNAENWLGEPDARHAQVVLALIELGEDHFQKAKAATTGLPDAVMATLKPVNLVPLYLRTAWRNPEHVLTGMRQPAQWRRQWALFRN